MRAVVLILLLLLLLPSCSDEPVVPPTTPDALHRPDAMGLDREAEEAALWLSGELTAPLELYETIHDDLAAIRDEYGDIIPVNWEWGGVPIVFIPWWETSYLVVFVSSELKAKVLAHEPNVLDDLNTGYHAAGMSAFAFRENATFGWRTEIRFAGRQNPAVLAGIYDAAEGINLAFPQDQLGDASNVYPSHIADGISYLFRNAFGDCPAGCIENQFYYFRRIDGVTEYVGNFHLGIDPLPSWWTEANNGFCEFLMQQRHLPSCGWAVTADRLPQHATSTASRVP